MSLKLVIAILCVLVPGMAQTSSSSVPPPPANAPEDSSKSLKPDPSQKEPKADVKATNSPTDKGAKQASPTEGDDNKISYEIGSLDVLSVKVWGNANMTGIYDVRSDGILSMPLVGEVRADGLTVKQLRTELAKRMDDAGIIKPDIDIQVLKINSKRYYVTGGVRKSGEFPISQPISVLDALILAGGFTDFANQKKIYVLRDGQKHMFNYKEAINGKNMAQNIMLKPNDRIVVPE